jgi:DNA repair and recombination protein RAD54 and RAD54-like protein
VSVGIYYSRQRKPERNGSVFTPIAAMYSSGHALPVANRSHGLVFGSLSKDWDDIRQRKDQLVNFLASLERASGDSAAAGKIEDSKLASPSVEPTEQKEKAAIIVLDSDDEDGNGSGNSKLASETNKELGTSGLINNIAERMAFNGSQAFGTVHTYGDKNTQIVPYGQCSALVNQFPLQTSWQPSIQFERVVLQKRPEEQRMQDLVVRPSISSLLN